MFQKLKMFYHRFSRHMRPAMAAMAVCAMAMCSAGAVDSGSTPSFNLATTMSAAVQSCVNDIVDMIAAVLPIGVTVLAVSVGVAYGTRFIKKIIKP